MELIHLAVVTPILQPLAPGDLHAIKLADLLGSHWADRFVLSSAFTNFAGVSAINAELTAVQDRTTVYIGVRNGSTTAQGVNALLSTGATIYAVDTATRSRIFHPKVYIACNDARAMAIVGSANLTHAGLHNNIETGVKIDLDLTNVDDLSCLENLERSVSDLPAAHPNNCYGITTRREIVQMMRDGRLVDERDPRVSTSVGVSKTGTSTGSRSPIQLPTVNPPRGSVRRRTPPPPVVPAPAAPAGGAHPAPSVAGAPHFGPLVWEKPNLPRGDLQLLIHGHSSGVLRLTQARFAVGGVRINQTTYFRHSVFGGLMWAVDPNDPGKEQASTIFSIVIQGVYVGDYALDISHKPAWEAGQGNYTTGLHWGDAVNVIKNPALVGCALRLYESAVVGSPFIIEID